MDIHNSNGQLWADQWDLEPRPRWKEKDKKWKDDDKSKWEKKILRLTWVKNINKKFENLCSSCPCIDIRYQKAIPLTSIDESFESFDDFDDELYKIYLLWKLASFFILLNDINRLW